MKLASLTLPLLALTLNLPLGAQTFSKQQLAQQYRLTCTSQNTRTMPGLALQCQQWRAAIEAMDDASDGDIDDEPLDAPAPWSPNRPDRQAGQGRPQSPAVNACIQFSVQRQSDGWPVWQFNNRCAADVVLAWCDKGAVCRSPVSEHTLRGGEVYRTVGLDKHGTGPRWLACPTTAFNSLSGEVWACWTKR